MDIIPGFILQSFSDNIDRKHNNGNEQKDRYKGVKNVLKGSYKENELSYQTFFSERGIPYGYKCGVEEEKRKGKITVEMMYTGKFIETKHFFYPASPPHKHELYENT